MKTSDIPEAAIPLIKALDDLKIRYEKTYDRKKKIFRLTVAASGDDYFWLAMFKDGVLYAHGVGERGC